MSSEVKQLIIVAEGTAALGTYWQTIVSDYLHNIIRSLCGIELNGERNPVSNVELSLVIFNSHGSHSACLVQRSGWTRDVDLFLHWLSSIQFAGGGFNEVATGEGLAQALMMFSPPSSQDQPSNDFKRHCILITASNSHTLHTPVYRPQLQTVERNENDAGQSDRRLLDAETVASYFPWLSVSLSVVCPKQFPKIRAIYNAAKLNPQSVDLSFDTVKNTFYLVLISENFVEARAALSHSASNFPQTQNPVKVKRATIAPSLPVTGQPPAPRPSADGAILNRQQADGAIVSPLDLLSQLEEKYIEAPVTGKPPAPMPSGSSADQALVTGRPVSVEPVPTATSWNPVEVKVVPSIPSVAQPATQAIPSIQTSSASPAGAVSSFWESVVARQQGITSMAGLNNSFSPAPVGQMVPAPVGQRPRSNNSFSPQTTSNVASNLGVSQTMPGMNQGNHSGGQRMQGAISMNQKMSGLGQGNVSFGRGGMMPTPGVGQQTQSGIQQLGGRNSSACNMQLSQLLSGPMQTSQSKSVKVWEGDLSGQRQGQPVLIARLEGYRSASASDSLAANWPPTMQILGLISQDEIVNKQDVVKMDFLMFRALSQHGFFGQLQAKKLCAVIQLPSQTLLLSVSEKSCLIGMLFPRLLRLKQLQQQLQLMPQRQQTWPLNQMQQQTSPLNQMQEQPQQDGDGEQQPGGGFMG